MERKIDYGVGDWVERIDGDNLPDSGMFIGMVYKVDGMERNTVTLEGISQRGWDANFFRLAKSHVIYNVLKEL